MTPFGKAASQITVADLEQLRETAAPEGQYLEFKEDIPVSDQDRKAQRHRGIERPVDRSWLRNNPLMDYGRDKILRELVGFANASGGLLVLGMGETTDKPSRAECLMPLPEVASLEGRLRDMMLSGIEPRLPYAVVRSLVTQDDGTSGLVVIEVEPSILGPHWVKHTREATTRREDRCVLLSMSEIHGMVVRNARRFDDIKSVLSERSQMFASAIDSAYEARARAEDFPVLGGSREHVNAWLKRNYQSAFGMRVSVVPHQNIGLPRLEVSDGLIPPQDCLLLLNSENWSNVTSATELWPKRFIRRLGGLESRHIYEFGQTRHIIRRDGFIELSWLSHNADTQCNLHPVSFATLIALSLGVYGRLRGRTGNSGIPAEVGVEIITRGRVQVPRLGKQPLESRPPLDAQVLFDYLTVGNEADFSEVINELAADLMNAVGLEASSLPRFRFEDTGF